jgi:haloacetate dehalogenase
MDHVASVRSLIMLDIAPTLSMYEKTNDAFAKAYWHWFFLIQPSPLPEQLIEADPAAYIRDLMGRRHAQFETASYEQLAIGQKIMLRLGLKNQSIVKTKLKEFRNLIDRPVS